MSGFEQFAAAMMVFAVVCLSAIASNLKHIAELIREQSSKNGGK